MGVVAAGVCQPPQTRAVWPDGVDLEIAVTETREGDQVPFRPSGPRLAFAHSTASRYCENRPGGKWGMR